MIIITIEKIKRQHFQQKQDIARTCRMSGKNRSQAIRLNYQMVIKKLPDIFAKAA